LTRLCQPVLEIQRGPLVGVGEELHLEKAGKQKGDMPRRQEGGRLGLKKIQGKRAQQTGITGEGIKENDQTSFSGLYRVEGEGS